MNNQTDKTYELTRQYLKALGCFSYLVWLPEIKRHVFFIETQEINNMFYSYRHEMEHKRTFISDISISGTYVVDIDIIHEFLVNCELMDADRVIVYAYFLMQTVQTDPVLKLKEAYHCDGFVIDTPETIRHYIFFDNMFNDTYTSSTIKAKIDYAFMHLDLVGSDEYEITRNNRNMKVIDYPYPHHKTVANARYGVLNTQNS